MGFLSGLFTAPGSSAMNQATQGLQGYANTQQGIYNQYGAPALQALYSQYMNPQNTPSQTAALNDFNASTGANTNAAAGQLQQQLVGRGLGGSSIMGNALSGLYANQVNTEAQNQQQNNAYNQQRGQSALQGLLGYGMGAENSLSGAYGQMYGMGQQQNQSAMSGLGGLASLAGYLY